MAANKFATMLHKNTNKITMILIYAVLEWTLICLLLLNSLFSHMIVKFADYFGLKPPCFWCSNKNLERDLLCESHSRDVSRLGFCESHQKLAESKGMCGDCSVSVQDFHGFSLLPWMKEVKMIENGEEIVLENGDEKCSCCGVSTFGSPYIVIKSSWDHLIKEAEKGENSDGKRSDFEGSMCEEEDEGVEVDDKEEKDLVLENGILEMKNGSEKDLVLENGIFEMKNGSQKDLVLENGILEMKDGSEKELVLENGILEMKNGSEKDLVLGNGISEENSERVMKDEGVQVDLSMETLPKHLEFFIDCSGNGLVPIELIDSMAEEDPKEANLDDEKKGKNGEESKFSVMESMEIEEDENSLVFYAKDCFSESEGYYAPFPKSSQQSKQVQILDSDTAPVSEEYSQMQINETEAEADVSIGTEIPDLDIADDLHCSNNEDPSTSCTNFLEIEDHGCKQDQEQTIELRALSVDLNENAKILNEPEEEKVPDTPNSLDRKKDCGSEESLDGSVMSELDSLDPVSAIERLKSALKSERKALHVLYTELEEERSASAVAANQTMAMINRLQEEKAAMQMEAVQYQRMMDEQSEYDQEALQLLNEVMVKREKERQELEKELEVYRKRVLEYEAKEKFALVLKRSKDNGSARSAFSSVSCSNGEEESDRMSIDLNQEAKEDERFYGSNDQNTPIDYVVNLEDSLVDFEEERMAILEQLKVLEEKLITMDYEEGEIEDLKREMNGHANGYAKEMNGKHDRKMLSSMGKSLLPLFDDAVSDENGDVHENGFYSNGVHDLDHDLENNKRVGVEEELDCLHERLQALEADREFLKHCISSLKKGDKGMDLLQEILQHLRDLRNVDLRVRNLSDGCLV